MASVVNHISEMLAYFLSFPLIRRIGHIKVMHFIIEVIRFAQTKILYSICPGSVFGSCLQCIALPLYFVHPRAMGRHPLRIDSGSNTLSCLGSCLLLHRAQYTTRITCFCPRSSIFHPQRGWTRMWNHFWWSLFHLLW